MTWGEMRDILTVAEVSRVVAQPCAIYKKLVT